MINLGLIGWPLSHSKSPVIHSSALKAMDLPGRYGLYPIHPSDQEGLLRVVDEVRRGNLTGINVTIPHKQKVMPLLDEISTNARSIGAVNTIFRQGKKLIGENTDATGFLCDLNTHFSDLSNRSINVIVLGAGGSARAVVCALVKVASKIFVAARRPDKAKSLVEDTFSGRSGLAIVSPILLDEISLKDITGSIDLIVNATPVGMHPNVDASPWPVGLPLPVGCCVYDLIYNPPETRLIKLAIKQGLGHTNGIGMLIEQAALSLEIWTGMPVPRDAMWSAIRQQPIITDQEA